MARTLTLDTPLHLAALAVEESDHDSSRYKKVHAFGCSGLRDPETVTFLGGKVKHLMEDLAGYAVCDGPVESELEYFEGMLLPCARRELGI